MREGGKTRGGRINFSLGAKQLVKVKAFKEKRDRTGEERLSGGKVLRKNPQGGLSGSEKIFCARIGLGRPRGIKK